MVILSFHLSYGKYTGFSLHPPPQKKALTDQADLPPQDCPVSSEVMDASGHKLFRLPQRLAGSWPAADSACGLGLGSV